MSTATQTLGKKLLRVGTLLPTLLLTLAGCATHIQAPPSSPALQSYSAAMQTYGRVLKQHVDTQGRVDFAGIAQAPQALEQVVRFIGEQSPASHPALYSTPNAVKAYHLNAYNALAMYAVVQEGIPKALKGYTFARFFLLNTVNVGGQSQSLYAYENNVIRKLGDARVHFALNCMSVGCPTLPQQPFSADTLDTQLDQEARAFFASPKHLRVEGNTVYVSEILKFFTADFLAVAPSLPAYINRYAPSPVPLDAKVQFIPYDWTINKQP